MNIIYFTEGDDNNLSLLRYLNNFYTALKSCITMKLDYGMIIFRGIHFPYDFKENSFIRINNFVSTSLNYDVARRFATGNGIVLIIYLPPGSDFCPIFNFTNKTRNEKEILLQSGSIFNVVKVNINPFRGKIKNVHLVYVGQQDLEYSLKTDYTNEEIDQLDMSDLFTKYLNKQDIKLLNDLVHKPYFYPTIKDLYNILYKLDDKDTSKDFIIEFEPILKHIIKLIDMKEYNHILSKFKLIYHDL